MKTPLFPATKEGVLKHAEYLYLEKLFFFYKGAVIHYIFNYPH